MGRCSSSSRCSGIFDSHCRRCCRHSRRRCSRAPTGTLLVLSLILPPLPTPSSPRSRSLTEPGPIFAATAVAESTSPRPRRPNIVILFADNLAYEDVGAFSSSWLPSSSSLTPNIDALASDGLKITAWTSPAVLCSASRAALLTGRYPVRTGVFPRVFEPDAALGLPSSEMTLAEYLKGEGYATMIVGKWHLGHAEGYKPVDRGFDAWVGVPYHMSGGSVDGHVCGDDVNGTKWLPLFEDGEILEQPVELGGLAERYARASEEFIEEHSGSGDSGGDGDDKDGAPGPFFLYVPFSHVHQLCAPHHNECQWSSPHYAPTPNRTSYQSDFHGAVREMDSIAGRVLDSLRDNAVVDDTLVIFTSDNGPWVAEGPGCAGSKGKFEGRWLRDNVDPACTACPSGYVADPTSETPRRCVHSDLGRLKVNVDGLAREENSHRGEEVQGIHCGEDTGLGSAWEANVRVPAVVRWPSGGVPRGGTTDELVSTLDVLPTILSFVGSNIPDNVDGVDVSDIFLGRKPGGTENRYDELDKDDEGFGRPIFYWRDGFSTGPLPQPYGRFDVVAVRFGRRYKAWLYTKSSHYNPDPEVCHDPPLLFDVLSDPAESRPLDPEEHPDLIRTVREVVREHRATVDLTRPGPRTMARDAKNLPCADRGAGCRTRPLPPSMHGVNGWENGVVK